MMSCSAIKAGGRRRKGGRSELWLLSTQVTIMCDGALLSWRCLNTCLPMGSSEWIPCFSLLAYTAFALPIKPSLCQPTSFLIFTDAKLSLLWITNCGFPTCLAGLLLIYRMVPKTACGRISRGAQQTQHKEGSEEPQHPVTPLWEKAAPSPCIPPHLGLAVVPHREEGCHEEVVLASCLLLILRLPGAGTLTASHSGNFSWFTLWFWQ